MEVRKGYKQTEVGVIPEDWAVKPLRELAQVRSGIAKNSNVEISDPILVHYLRVANVQDGFLDLSEMSLISINRYDLNRFAVLPGDVLMNEGGDLDKLGRGSIWQGEFSPCVHQNHVFVVRCGKGLAPKYLNLWTGAAVTRRFFLVAGKQTTNLASISKTALGQLPVAVPCMVEQEAIAEALSDADALIESLTQLISKKRQIKQGAMQELLTGKRRLHGFAPANNGYKQTEVGVIPEDWEASSLGNLTVLMTNGFVGTATQHYADNENGVLYIQGYNVEENAFNFHGIKYVTEEFHRMHMKSCLRGGDLLTVQTGDVGLTTIVPDQLAGSNCHALIISRLEKKLASPTFISYYLNSNPGRSRMRLIETGTTMKHLNVGDMLQFLVPLPPTKAEQEAIAEVLSEMDDELAVLEAKLTKARALKQGMMHELLTGRIRLV